VSKECDNGKDGAIRIAGTNREGYQLNLNKMNINNEVR
jgi:hypothetical protein